MAIYSCSSCNADRGDNVLPKSKKAFATTSIAAYSKPISIFHTAIYIQPSQIFIPFLTFLSRFPFTTLPL